MQLSLVVFVLSFLLLLVEAEAPLSLLPIFELLSLLLLLEGAVGAEALLFLLYLPLLVLSLLLLLLLLREAGAKICGVTSSPKSDETQKTVC